LVIIINNIDKKTKKDKPCIQALTRYVLSKSAGSSSSSSPNPLSQLLPGLLSPSGTGEVGLVLAERLLNMPPEVVPPMYRMLAEEIEWANQENEAYTFSHYLVLSKTYKEVESALDAAPEPEDAPPSAKKARRKEKSMRAAAVDSTFYFHPEDEVLKEHAVGHVNFDYTTLADEGRADSKRAFQDMGIVPQGHMILIERSKLDSAIKALTEYLCLPVN
jgi:protein BCP1